MEAFIRGDQSGTVLNRGIVSGAHVLGMLFSPDVKDTPTMLKFYARRTQIALECLAELLKGTDYRTTLQSLTMTTSSYLLIHMTQTGQLYVQKSCDLIEAGNLRFLPTSGRPPEFSEELHETLVGLSQTIYWANYLYLMRGGPEPRATAKLEREFRYELPVGGVPSILLYIELIFYHSKLIRFSLRSAPLRCGREVSCLSGTRFCSLQSFLPTVSITCPFL